MTEVGHVITGAAIGVLGMPKNISTKQRFSHVTAFMLIATIPDWPFKNWGHDRYYFSHSLFVTLLLLSLLFITFLFSKDLRKKIGDWPVIISGSLAWLSHLLLDSFYNHGKGIAIYWPFSKARLTLPIPWFDVGTGSLAHLMQVFLIEFIRTYLKNGRLWSKPWLGVDQWISKTNNGQLSNLYFRKWNAERMARDVREWTTVRS